MDGWMDETNTYIKQNESYTYHKEGGVWWYSFLKIFFINLFIKNLVDSLLFL